MELSQNLINIANPQCAPLLLPPSPCSTSSVTNTTTSSLPVVSHLQPDSSHISQGQGQGQGPLRGQQNFDTKTQGISAITSSSATVAVAVTGTDSETKTGSPHQSYKCRHCLLPFLIKEYRRRHESISHKFKCRSKSCSLRFTQLAQCQKHENFSHAERDLEHGNDVEVDASNKSIINSQGPNQTQIDARTDKVSISPTNQTSAEAETCSGTGSLQDVSTSPFKEQQTQNQFEEQAAKNDNPIQYNNQAQNQLELPILAKIPAQLIHSIPSNLPLATSTSTPTPEASSKTAPEPESQSHFLPNGQLLSVNVEPKHSETGRTLPSSESVPQTQTVPETTSTSVTSAATSASADEEGTDCFINVNLKPHVEVANNDDDENDNDEESNNPLLLAQVVYTENEEESDVEADADNYEYVNKNDSKNHSNNFAGSGSGSGSDYGSGSYYDSDADPDCDQDPDQQRDPEQGQETENTSPSTSTDSDNFQIFKCDYCDNHYLSTKDLHNHVEQFHQKEKQHKKGQSQNQERGASSSSGTNPYIDTKIPNQIKPNTKAKVQKNTIPNTFICHYCPMSFTQEWLRLTHMQCHHWVQLNQESMSITMTNSTSAINSAPHTPPQSQSQSSIFHKFKYNLRKSALKKYSHTKSPKPLTPNSTTRTRTRTRATQARSSRSFRLGTQQRPRSVQKQILDESDPESESPRKRTLLSNLDHGQHASDYDYDSDSLEPDPEPQPEPKLVPAPVPEPKMEQEQSVTVPQRNENHKYNCSYCGKEVSTRQYLQVHERIHTGVKPFKCPYKNCRKAFIRKQSMVNHVRVHTGEKPYGCSICGRYFRVITNLYQHSETHGEIDPALKPYRRIGPGCGSPSHSATNTIATITTSHSISPSKKIDDDASRNSLLLNNALKRCARKKTWPSSRTLNRSNVNEFRDNGYGSSSLSNYSLPDNFKYWGKIEPEEQDQNQEEDVEDQEREQEQDLEEESEPEREQDQEPEPEVCLPLSSWRGIKTDPGSGAGVKENCEVHSQGHGQSLRQNQRRLKYQPLPLPSRIKQVLDVHVVQYICDICNRKFSYRTEAIRHLRSFHNVYD